MKMPECEYCGSKHYETQYCDPAEMANRVDELREALEEHNQDCRPPTAGYSYR